MEYELTHHGIKGMKWGVRRFQNADGTLTAAGRKRAARQEYRSAKKKALKDFNERNAELQKSGRGNDVDAVTKSAAKYDAARNSAKAAYRQAREADRTRDWSDDAKTAASLKKKSVNEMSNKELKQINERIRLEQEYARLNPTTVNKGKKLAGDILANAAKESAKNFVSKQIGKGITKGGEIIVDQVRKRKG